MKENTIIKFLRGSCTPGQEKEVFQWLEHPGSREKLNDILEKHFESPNPQWEDRSDYREILENIHQKILKPQKPKPSYFKILTIQSLRTAASLMLILFSVYILKESISYKDNIQLVSKLEPIEELVRTTGAGEKMKITMPDQTKITVNSLSEISYSSDYGKNERIVKVKGEAFFEVAHDPNKPFKVISNGLTTTALGTSFNVYARNDYRIALTEGKVSVASADREVELVPGLMALWEKSDRSEPEFEVRSFDLEKIIGWKDGILVFDKKPLKEILKDLEDWYGVEMKIQKGVDVNRKVIGSFENKNLKDILTGLSFSIGFDFEIEGKNVQIKNISL
ncbi:FecR family protein [Aquiflexum sp.]|uniref:FecR family protein n=1 Tax=Aquiflexum sp. TaxID=1872584 RepID=UPI003593B505